MKDQKLNWDHQQKGSWIINIWWITLEDHFLLNQEMGKKCFQLAISVWNHFFCLFAYQHHYYYCLWSFHHCHLHHLCYYYFLFLFYYFLCSWLSCLLLMSKISLINMSNFGLITFFHFLFCLPHKKNLDLFIYILVFCYHSNVMSEKLNVYYSKHSSI